MTLFFFSSLVVLKTPADFIGAHLGESEKQTKNILTNSIGKVLIIDEVRLSAFQIPMPPCSYSYVGIHVVRGRREQRWESVQSV